MLPHTAHDPYRVCLFPFIRHKYGIYGARLLLLFCSPGRNSLASESAMCVFHPRALSRLCTAPPTPPTPLPRARVPFSFLRPCAPQTMLASDVQSLMGDVLRLVSRVAIEDLWPQHHPFGARSTPARSRARPQTYGAAYRSLLEERDLLALGIHRPPARRGDGSAATSGGRRSCPGGSRYVAINCPGASFALQDGDFIFVLRRTTTRVESAACGAS